MIFPFIILFAKKHSAKQKNILPTLEEKKVKVPLRRVLKEYASEKKGKHRLWGPFPPYETGERGSTGKQQRIIVGWWYEV